MKHINTIILGAGVTGVYAAKVLGKGTAVIEKNGYVGGLCSSFDWEGFTLDYGPHKLFSTIPGIMDEFRRINGDDNVLVPKQNSLYFLDKKFQFPVKPVEMLKNINPKLIWVGLKIAAGFFQSIITYHVFRKKDDSFKDYLVKGFGRPLYSILFEGYAWKVWDDPDKLSKDIAEIRIPVPDIGNLIKNTFSKGSQVKVNASEFYYPRKGMRQFCDKIADEARKNGSDIILGETVTEIDKKGSIFMIKTDKDEYSCDHLINTLPINNLITIYRPAGDRLTNTELKYNDLSLIHILIDRPKITDDNWIFFPELKYSFNRVSEQKGFSVSTGPADKTVLCAEVTNPKINAISKDEIINRVTEDLKKARIINSKEDISKTHFIKLPKIYPVYDIGHKQKLLALLGFLDDENIITIGRFGLFNYNNIDHCFDMVHTYKEHLDSKGSMDDWKHKREKFFSYRIVD